VRHSDVRVLTTGEHFQLALRPVVLVVGSAHNVLAGGATVAGILTDTLKTAIRLQLTQGTVLTVKVVA
jgi:sRNA-binding protein